MQSMKTTAMMIEFLIAGVMMLFSLIVLALSFFPDSVMNLAYWIRFQHKWMNNLPFIILVFVSISYSFGIFIESFALHLFEPTMKRIQRNRFDHFIQAVEKINKKYLKKPVDLVDIQANPDRSFTGMVRYYVLQKNPLLYSEIEMQHHRLRLSRVFCLFSAIILLGIGYQYALQPTSISISSVFVLLILIVYRSIKTVRYRFERYCIAIERTYKALLLELPKQ